MKRGKKTIYRNIEYRSKWEVYVAKLLLYSDYRFEYEPQRFFFSRNLSYLVDFYIPEKHLYIEVKGYLDNKSKLCLDIFQRTNKILYLGASQLSEIFGDSAAKISKLDIVNYRPNAEEVFRFKELLRNA